MLEVLLAVPHAGEVQLHPPEAPQNLLGLEGPAQGATAAHGIAVVGPVPLGGAGLSWPNLARPALSRHPIGPFRRQGYIADIALLPVRAE